MASANSGTGATRGGDSSIAGDIKDMLRGNGRQSSGAGSGANSNSGGNKAPAPSLGKFLKGRDLSKVDDGLVLIPRGTFVRVVCVKADPAPSQQGNPMITLTQEVTFPEEYAGKKFTDRLTFTPKSEWKFKGCCRIAGLLSEDGKDFLGDDEQAFVGKEWGAVLGESTWQGTKRNEMIGGYKYLDGNADEGDDSGSGQQMFGGLPGGDSYGDTLPGDESPFGS